LVVSYSPLTIYFYEEGLVRFATFQYDIGDAELKNVFSHLTNTSINKFSPTLETVKEGIGSGCRWKFDQLNSYFQSKNIDFNKIWGKIKSIVILTLLPVAPEVKINPKGCFELYGFGKFRFVHSLDILIDDNLKPWLLGTLNDSHK
jgi:tubulin polyglutamylase TTLL2